LHNFLHEYDECYVNFMQCSTHSHWPWPRSRSHSCWPYFWPHNTFLVLASSYSGFIIIPVEVLFYPTNLTSLLMLTFDS